VAPDASDHRQYQTVLDSYVAPLDRIGIGLPVWFARSLFASYVGGYSARAAKPRRPPEASD
jgi:hypothetical protein